MTTNDKDKDKAAELRGIGYSFATDWLARHARSGVVGDSQKLVDTSARACALWSAIQDGATEHGFRRVGVTSGATAKWADANPERRRDLSAAHKVVGAARRYHGVLARADVLVTGGALAPWSTGSTSEAAIAAMLMADIMGPQPGPLIVGAFEALGINPEDKCDPESPAAWFVAWLACKTQACHAFTQQMFKVIELHHDGFPGSASPERSLLALQDIWDGKAAQWASAWYLPLYAENVDDIPEDEKAHPVVRCVSFREPGRGPRASIQTVVSMDDEPSGVGSVYGWLSAVSADTTEGGKGFSYKDW